MLYSKKSTRIDLGLMPTAEAVQAIVIVGPLKQRGFRIPDAKIFITCAHQHIDTDMPPDLFNRQGPQFRARVRYPFVSYGNDTRNRRCQKPFSRLMPAPFRRTCRTFVFSAFPTLTSRQLVPIPFSRQSISLFRSLINCLKGVGTSFHAPHRLFQPTPVTRLDNIYSGKVCSEACLLPMLYRFQWSKTGGPR